MPKKTHNHEHNHQHHEAQSQRGFIKNTLKRNMNKNEKIIMGILVGGIVLFLALSIVVLFGKGNNSITPPDSSTPTTTITKTKDGRVVTYPTLAPVENMTIMINSRRFNPSTVTIPRGGYVDFLNIGQESMTIEANDQNSAVLNLGEIEPSEDKLVTFNTPGTYTFRNKDKPTQVGIIIVK